MRFRRVVVGIDFPARSLAAALGGRALRAGGGDRARARASRAGGAAVPPAARRADARPPVKHVSMFAASRRHLLVALVQEQWLEAVVPMTMEIVEGDPLESAGCFAGDLVRGLMEVPGHFWVRHPRLYERYRRALRSAAVARRQLTPEARMEFWSVLDVAAIQRTSGDDAASRAAASSPRH